MKEPRSALFADIIEVLELAGPNALGFVSVLLNELTNVVFLGHTSNEAALAAVGMGNMMQNCIGLSVGLGIANGLDTLISQAHGAKQTSLIIDYLQRSRVVVSMQLFWMMPLLAFSEPILLVIGLDKDVARDAGRYNIASMFGLLAVFQFEIYQRFYQNQGFTVGPAVISWLTTLLHPLWCCVFVVYYDLGNFGTGLANITTWYLSWLLIAIYSYVRAPQMGFTRWQLIGLSSTACKGWGELLQVSLPAALQTCCEWWFFEVCAILVGYIGDGKTPLAAHVAAMNFVAVIVMPASGTAAAVATLAGNYIGAKDAVKAKRLVKVCVGVNATVWMFLGLFISFGKDLIAHVYVQADEFEVQVLMKSLLTIYVLAGLCDTNQIVLGGALRGLGHQKVAVAVYITAFYGFMLPLGGVLAFPMGFGVSGIWWSILAGTTLTSAFLGWYILHLDFHKVVEDAEERIENNKVKVNVDDAMGPYLPLAAGS